ncbi:hypothetical protein [Polaribacter atrinae]|uniref:hypothetical protein n=1 Tax=Polaribacter atrinae TaxID=1333662 RepID=UPI0030F609A4
MNTKNLLFTFLTFFTFTFFAQESKTFDVIVENGEVKSNQLLLNFLKTDSRLSDFQLKQLIEIQKKTNSSDYNSSNTRKEKVFGQPSPTITTIFFDNEMILGEGINKLYVLDRVRMKEIKKISTSNVSYDKKIYISKI